MIRLGSVNTDAATDIKSVTIDDGTPVIATTLYPDSDATQSAFAMCVGMQAFAEGKTPQPEGLIIKSRTGTNLVDLSKIGDDCHVATG